MIKRLFCLLTILLLAGCAKQPVQPAGTISSKSATARIKAPPRAEAPQPLLPYSYVIKPGDWLSRIALAEYGSIDKWHHIYAWNRAWIGDNPDRILPYLELQLRKPGIENKERLFRIHTVERGESLWSIAATEYGDGRAWLLIFHDNRGMFTNGIGFLWPGMELRVRKAL